MAVLRKMTTVTILPLADYALGLVMHGPVDVAADVTSVDFSIQCWTLATPLIWPLVTTVLTITPEVSTDGGLTWIEAGKSVTPGGPHLDKFGQPLSFVRSGGGLPAPVNGVTRQYRVWTDITGGLLRSLVNLEVN